MADQVHITELAEAAAYTIVTIINNTDNSVSKGNPDTDIKDWYGNGERPYLVEAQADGKFKHDADQQSRGGSVGGNAYIYNDVFKWIFAWSTTGEGKKNKVYTDIQKANYTIPWDDIKDALHSDKTTDTATKISTEYGFTSTVTIDDNNPKPTLKATLKKSD